MYLTLIITVTIATYAQGVPTFRNISNHSLKKSSASSLSICHFPARQTSANDQDECRASGCACGVTKNSGSTSSSRRRRIIAFNDGEAKDGKWPWMAYIVERRGCAGVCGGTLLNNKWVISAAQCVKNPDRNPSEIGVIFGEHKMSVISGREVYASVKKITVHPSYNSEALDNDVALIQLKNPVQYTKFIKPACLVPCGTDTDNINSKTSVFGETCLTLGWGFSTNDGPRSDTLRELDVIVAPKRECIRLTAMYRARVKDNDAKFCAGGMAGQGVCTGDTGGPLLCYKNKKYYLHGVVSTRPDPCAKNNMPDVYTKIGDPFINNWITTTMSDSPSENFRDITDPRSCSN